MTLDELIEKLQKTRASLKIDVPVCLEDSSNALEPAVKTYLKGKSTYSGIEYTLVISTNIPEGQKLFMFKKYLDESSI